MSKNNSKAAKGKAEIKAVGATDSVAVAIKTATDRAMQKDNVSNGNKLRVDAQLNGIALMAARTYCASSINGACLKLVADLDKKAIKFDGAKHVIKCVGNKGACFTIATGGIGKQGDHSFALFGDGTIIALGSFGQLTVSDAGTEDRFCADISKGEHYAKGHKIVIADGKEKGKELTGIIVGTEMNTTDTYYGFVYRGEGNKLIVTTKERERNCYNANIGALTATVGEATAKECALVTGAKLASGKAKAKA